MRQRIGSMLVVLAVGLPVAMLTAGALLYQFSSATANGVIIDVRLGEMT